MRGPSADAQARLLEQLAQAIGGAESRKTAEVGDDLCRLAEVIRSESRLRRAVTDVSVDSDAKAQFVRQLFGEKVDSISLDLLAAAVSQRWTTPSHLPDTLERLGVETVVRSAEDAGRVADELFDVERLLVDHPDLRDALSDPARSTDDKRALLASLFEGRILTSTMRLVEQAVTGSHRTVALAIREYQKVAAAVQGEQVATVRVARELTESEQERLGNALRRQYDRDVHLNVIVDESVIGGIRVEIGDDVIDGTVASRLDEARRRLAG